MGQYFDNQKLPSKMVKYDAFVLGKKFVFYTDNGVFSKDGLDFGSRLLLESIPLEEVGGKVLDMGCGYGVLGIVLNSITLCEVDMVDVNLRAMHLAEINSKENHCTGVSIFESNCYEKVNSKYSCIITNPPIRAGKNVVYNIVMNARDYLEENGHLFLVIRKEQGAKSLIIDLEKLYTVEVLNKKKGFFILKCTSK
ncbi:MAG: class I SAM-dependent methyltransferase [Bacilli bacterium]|nr:class I SAM-dependent methyltransferase [Bacilli bacterium]